MTVYEKMKEVTHHEDADKETIVQWAYINRIHIANLHSEEPFSNFKETVNAFYLAEESMDEFEDEFKLWRKFLEFEYII